MRRTHTKSRRGCANCKRRHVRCDEAQPQCGPCSKRSIDCDYGTRQNTPQTPPNPSPRSQDTPITKALAPKELNLADLELMHFYCTESYKCLTGFGDSANNEHVLRWDAVPKLAFNSPVLMHALLCFSASHLRHITPSPGVYDFLVYHHKSRALSLLQKELSSLTTVEGMNDNIYATSSFLAAQALADFSSSSPTSPNIEWIHLIRGTKAVLEPMWDHRERSIFYAHLAYTSPEIPNNPTALNKFNLSNVAAHLPAAYSSHVVKLANLMDALFPERQYTLPPEDHEDHPEYRFAGHVKHRIRDLFIWAVSLPNTFGSRVEEHDPGILKLLAWLNAAMRELYYLERECWWIENMAQHGVRDVIRFLP